MASHSDKDDTAGTYPKKISHNSLFKSLKSFQTRCWFRSWMHSMKLFCKDCKLRVVQVCSNFYFNHDSNGKTDKSQCLNQTSTSSLSNFNSKSSNSSIEPPQPVSAFAIRNSTRPISVSVEKYLSKPAIRRLPGRIMGFVCIECWGGGWNSSITLIVVSSNSLTRWPWSIRSALGFTKIGMRGLCERIWRK